MIKYEIAEKIARAIYFYGWDSLSYTEEAVLKKDIESKNLVNSLISTIRRLEMLKNGESVNYSLGIYEHESKILTSWEFGDMAFEARLFKHKISDRVVLEVKQWLKDDFHGYSQVGSHEMIFQEPIEFSNTTELLNKCKKILSQYNCTAEKMDDIDKEIEDFKYNNLNQQDYHKQIKM